MSLGMRSTCPLGEEAAIPAKATRGHSAIARATHPSGKGDQRWFPGGKKSCLGGRWVTR